VAIETLSAALRQINRLWADGSTTGFSDGQLLERFLFGHDAAAFEALVAHHGPMVLSVCRGILRDPNDAEDAFQATFLILVRKSSTLRRHEALGPWLYRVAHRVAIRANAAAARRRACERRAGQMAATTSMSGPAVPDEQLQALHEEIARLPEKLRRPVILCDLQSVPQKRAAGELRLNERTLQRRLSEGRQRLKTRLIRRGLAPEGAALGPALLRQARVTVPPAWGEATVRAALATVNQSITVGVVSAGAKELTREVLRLMLLQKLTMASATLFAAGVIALGASAALVSLQEEPTLKLAARPNLPRQQKAETAVSNALARSWESEPPGEPRRNPARTEPRPPEITQVRFESGPNSRETTGKVAVRGRVLAPDGRPVPGAKLYMTLAWGYPHEPSPSPEYATTGPDGRFQFAVPEAQFGNQFTVVAATAPNFGVGWVDVPADDKRDELTIRLVDDDVAITGQIIDLEGKPVEGATLRLMQVNAAPAEDLGPWLEAVTGKKGLSGDLEQRYLKRFTLAVPLQVTTDSAGRFRLTGIGRNRLVTAQLDGPTIISEHLHMLTRPGAMIEVTKYEGKPEYNDPRQVTTYYGAAFRHAAAPTKPIVGVVRDIDTRKPLAGVTIRSLSLKISPGSYRQFDLVRTTTDAQGRYRLTGMPKRDGNQIAAISDRDQPYVPTHKDIADSPGLDPMTADIELKRGVWIEGKITDKVTGQPLRGTVEYFAMNGNPNLRDFPGFDGTFPFIDAGVRTKEDGSYRVVGLPGPGLVAAYPSKNHYLRAPEREDEYGTKENSLSTAPYQLIFTSNYSALARVDPAKGVDSVKRDVTLDPGWSIKGTVLGPDAQPLAGARSFDLDSKSYWVRDGMKTAEFTGWFNPRRPRDVLFQHLEKGLVGVAQPPKENGGSVTVHMESGAAVRGRLVGADGRLRAGVELEVSFRRKALQSWIDYSPKRITTDQEGRFRIAVLLPGYEFRLADGMGELPIGGGLRSGETKDLGEVQMSVPKPDDPKPSKP
jgi:RNA polymerase sigma factor (sigma-70 family)